MSMFRWFFRLAAVLMLSWGAASGQGLAELLNSLQERQQAISQSQQVAAYLEGLNGFGPDIPNQKQIEWTGLAAGKSFPLESDIPAGIEARVALLNQAVMEFRRIQRSYLNMRAEDLDGNRVGALRPFMREDFPELGRVTASNYHAVLSALAHQVLRLRVLPWPVAGQRQIHHYRVSKWETTIINGNAMTGIKVETEEGSMPFDGWSLSSVGPAVAVDPPQDSWGVSSQAGVLSEQVYAGASSGSSNHTTADYGSFTLRSLNAFMTGSFFTKVMLVSKVPGEGTDQINGKVAMVARSLWTPSAAGDYTAPADWNNQDAGYTIIRTAVDSAASETLESPSITINLQWFNLPGSPPGSTSSGALPSGFDDYKELCQGGSQQNWNKSWESFSFDDFREPIMLHRHLSGIAAPAFSKGLDDSVVKARLAAAAEHTSVPSGDAVPELHPVPGILLGVPLGQGISGTSTGWIGWSPGDMRFHAMPIEETPDGAGSFVVSWNSSSLFFPQNVASSGRMIRFDHGANLRFIGPAEDFHVAYETSRTARGGSIPATIPTLAERESSGWNGTGDDLGDPPSWKGHFFTAWDAPRLRQVVSRDFIVDVTHTGHYSCEIKIYRRPISAGPVNRAPGHLETPVPSNLVRTLVCTNPAVVGTPPPALPAVPEQIEMKDGNVKYRVWRDGLESASTANIHPLRFELKEGEAVRWSKVIEFPGGSVDAEVTTTVDAAPPVVDKISGAWPEGAYLDGSRIGWNWWDYRTAKSIQRRINNVPMAQITNTIDSNSPGSQRGAWPWKSEVVASGELNATLEWQSSGVENYVSQGRWRTAWEVTAAVPTTLVERTRLDGPAGPVTAISWTDWLDGGRRVRTYRSPTGNGTKGSPATFWSEIEYGQSSGLGLPGLPHLIRNSDGTGATFAWVVSGGGSELKVEEGKLPGNSVTGRLRRTTRSVNERGYPSWDKVEWIGAPGNLQVAGATYSDFTAWGMPKSSSVYGSGLATQWQTLGTLSRWNSVTTPLGLVTTFGQYDALGRVGQVTSNGIVATISRAGLNQTTTVTGAVSGSLTVNRDGMGRITNATNTWSGVTTGAGITYGTSTLGVTLNAGAYGSHPVSIRRNDGSLEQAGGATLPFNGVEGTALSVSGGLLVSRSAFKDALGTFEEVRTDAFGRVRQVSTPSKSGGSPAVTNVTWSNPTSQVKRVVTTEPTGRRLITESEPFHASGSMVRSGIDVNLNGQLGASDRFTESVTTVDSTKVTTKLSVTEDGGAMREVLKSEWTPATGVTVTTINGGEETITSTPNWTTKSNTTTSSKGWERTTTLNKLGLPTINKLTGTGVPTTQLKPVWRADGSLASVSLQIGTETHSAGFHPDGRLSSLTVPGRGNILGEHTIENGKEKLALDGVTVERSLDGTETTVTGGTVAKEDKLALNGGGFSQKVKTTGAGAALTTTSFNAAMAPTAKTYADGLGESYTYSGELPTGVSLARGGSVSLAYSNDGAKDLVSAAWPAVTSGPLAVDGFAHGFSYDRAGRIKTVADGSGVRTLGYTKGRLASSVWTAGPLNGHEVLRVADGSGRIAGAAVKRDGALVHTVERAFNGVTGQVKELVSGGIKVRPLRDGAGRMTGFQWGNASGTFTTAVSQTWTRGAGGRITQAGNNVTGAPKFNYNPAGVTTFDGRGRRLKSVTEGGTWTYGYGAAGQLTSAVHPVLGSFSYAFDGIGRRTNKGAANTADVLNQTVAWTHSQARTLKITAKPGARVWLKTGTGALTEIPGFTGSYALAVPSPGSGGGWFAWETLAVLEGAGDGSGSPAVNPLASPDAKAEMRGALWVPPVNEEFHYDEAGNRLSSAQWNYGWDAANRLVRVRTEDYLTVPQAYDVAFAYDAEGRRVKKHVSEFRNGAKVSEKVVTYLWDGWDLLYERHQHPDGLTLLERRYLWGPDIADGAAGGAGGLLIISEKRGNVTTNLIPLYDGTGHVVALTNLSKELLASYSYGPFGEKIRATGPHAQSNPWRYATKYLDEETGLYYFGHRYYDPVTGQWLSREPLGESESLNLYSYCHNDPVNKVDVLGLAEVVTSTPGGNGVLVNDETTFWLIYNIMADAGLVGKLDPWDMGAKPTFADAMLVAGKLGGTVKNYSKAWPWAATGEASQNDLWIMPFTVPQLPGSQGGNLDSFLTGFHAAKLGQSGGVFLDAIDIRAIQAAGEATSAYPWGSLSKSETQILSDRGAVLTWLDTPLLTVGGGDGSGEYWGPYWGKWQSVAGPRGLEYAMGTTPFGTPRMVRNMVGFEIGTAGLVKGFSVVKSIAAKTGAEATERGGLNLFKWNHPTSTRATGWKEGDRFLYLPNQGSAQANWIQNSSRLRGEIRSGNPIYETFVDGAGNLMPTRGFLNAERNLLQNRGWNYNPATRAWTPPTQ